MSLMTSLPNSVGQMLHQVSTQNTMPEYGLLFRSNASEGLDKDQKAAKEVLNKPMLQRFVGVQYIKATERQSHYSQCQMGNQYDFVIHLNETHAIKSLVWEKDNVRPGTTDYSKWNYLDTSDEEDDSENYWF